MILPRRNVLIFHAAALGDFALTWPIAMAAARLWPTQRVIYVTSPAKGELAERAIGVEWRDGDALHALFRDDLDPSSADALAIQLPNAATKLLAGATLILSSLSNGDDAWARNVKRLAPEAPLICIKPRPDGPIDRHLTVFHAEQLAAQRELQAAVGQMLQHVAAAGAVPRRPGGSDGVVIHPGSGGAAKRWPAGRFAALAGELRGTGRHVAFLLGEVERETWRPDELDAVRNAATVLTPATPVDLLDVVRGAAAYIGNDSGPTHLAGLCGVPTLALFGDDNDVTWRPLGPRVRVLKHRPLGDLDLEAVLSAATEMLAAAPAIAEAAVTVEDD